MHLLWGEQKNRAKEAIRKLYEAKHLVIQEPCDCGSRIRHNNGGNYHKIVTIALDAGEAFIKYDTTCELTPPAEWQECISPELIICDLADWL